MKDAIVIVVFFIIAVLVIKFVPFWIILGIIGSAVVYIYRQDIRRFFKEL